MGRGARAAVIDLDARRPRLQSMPGTVARPTRSQRDALVLGVFVVSGAAGLIYQVVWSSQLLLVFGNTTEAIGTIVTAFMAGLGFGGLAGGLVAPRLRYPLRWGSRCWISTMGTGKFSGMPPSTDW